ncbi:hypothetical protein RFI_39138, partial [Reticulomyxa filosa]
GRHEKSTQVTLLFILVLALTKETETKKENTAAREHVTSNPNENKDKHNNTKKSKSKNKGKKNNKIREKKSKRKKNKKNKNANISIPHQTQDPPTDWCKPDIVVLPIVGDITQNNSDVARKVLANNCLKSAEEAYEVEKILGDRAIYRHGVMERQYLIRW